MLVAKDLQLRFGGVKALDGVGIDIGCRDVVGVIGPNGSGKSTLVNVLTGHYRADAGDLTLDGADLARSGPEGLRARGVARTFQNLRLVQEMTVIDNVLAGAYLRFAGTGMALPRWVAELVSTPASRRRHRAAVDASHQALRDVGLDGQEQAPARALSYGDQKRLEIARALVDRPQILILDEPTAGLAVDEADDLVRTIVGLAKDDAAAPMGVLLVEHRLELVLDVSDRVVVMDGGQIVARGTPGVISQDSNVRRIYVGGE